MSWFGFDEKKTFHTEEPTERIPTQPGNTHSEASKKPPRTHKNGLYNQTPGHTKSRAPDAVSRENNTFRATNTHHLLSPGHFGQYTSWKDYQTEPTQATVGKENVDLN